MNGKKLESIVSQKTEIDETTVHKVLNSVLSVIRHTVKHNESVSLRRFGVFHPVHHQMTDESQRIWNQIRWNAAMGMKADDSPEKWSQVRFTPTENWNVFDVEWETPPEAPDSLKNTSRMSDMID